MQKTLTMIGNAHIDPVWLWDWRDGHRTTLATCHAAVEILDEFPETVFTASSLQLHLWVEEADPALFARIAGHVAAGRWVICGGMWIEPDCNLPGAESFARHIHLSQRYMLSRFGRLITTGYNVDSFGHTATLPKILAAGRIENYCFSRPGTHEKELPDGTFLWEADDGSQVLAYRIPFSYGTFGHLGAHIDRVRDLLDERHPDLMCFYGVGNHGGGPTRENILEIRARMADSGDPVQYRFGDPESWFAAERRRRDDWPVVRGDLQFHAIGCYSVHRGIKRDVRRAEAALLDAEALAVMAQWLCPDYKVPQLDQAWQRLLFNQFHDTLAGTSIATAYRDARDQLGAAITAADEAATLALARIAAAIDTTATQSPSPDPDAPVHVSGQSAVPLLVCNPTGAERRELVRCEIAPREHVDRPGAWEALGPDGMRLPVQLEPPAAHVDGRVTLCFPAQLPALGYALYQLYPVAGAAEPRRPAVPAAASYPLGDGCLLTLDPEAPERSELTHEGELLLRLPPQLYALPDSSDTWSHGIDRFAADFAAEAKRFRLLGLRPCSAGIHCETWCWTYELGASRAWIYLDIDRVHGRLDWRFVVNWQERSAILKLGFEGRETPRLRVAVPFGSREVACDGREFPFGPWCTLETGGRHGRHTLVLANRAIGGASHDGRRLLLTLLRSPAYAHHDPHVITEEIDDQACIDLGVHSFHLAMRALPGPARAQDGARLATALAQPLRAGLATVHRGRQTEASAGRLTVEPGNIQITAVKPNTEGCAAVVRFYESEGRATVARLRWGDAKPQELEVGAHALVTCLVMEEGSFVPVDLLEEPLPALPLEIGPPAGAEDIQEQG
ncbi:MAG: hypothetical protein QM270_04450 [Bacillota bacterium]|nr:hypothetical protein [Bacillota bacterium]